MAIQPPPIYEQIADSETGKATLPWILYFNEVFLGDQGTSWTPTFQGLTTVGTPTITGRYYKVGALAYFSVTITPSTSTTSTAGTTYIDNFPLSIALDGLCADVTGTTSAALGVCQASTNRIYPSSWTAITSPITIVGLVVAS